MKGDLYYGTTVSAESNLVLNLFFTDLASASHAVVTYEDHYGVDHALNIDATDFYTRGDPFGVVVDQLVIADCSELITCKVYADDTLLASATDSIESYAARAIAANSDGDVV